MQIVLPSA